MRVHIPKPKTDDQMITPVLKSEIYASFFYATGREMMIEKVGFRKEKSEVWVREPFSRGLQPGGVFFGGNGLGKFAGGGV